MRSPASNNQRLWISNRLCSQARAAKEVYTPWRYLDQLLELVARDLVAVRGDETPQEGDTLLKGALLQRHKHGHNLLVQHKAAVVAVQVAEQLLSEALAAQLEYFLQRKPSTFAASLASAIVSASTIGMKANTLSIVVGPMQNQTRRGSNAAAAQCWAMVVTLQLTLKVGKLTALLFAYLRNSLSNFLSCSKWLPLLMPFLPRCTDVLIEVACFTFSLAHCQGCQHISY